MPLFRQRYLDLASNGSRIDRSELKFALKAAYQVINKPAPELVILNSPLACLEYIEYNKLDKKNQLGGQLWGQLWGQLKYQLRDQLGGQLWGQLKYQLRDQLGGQLWGQLRDQLLGCPDFLCGTQDLNWIACGKFAEYIGIKLDAHTLQHLDIIHNISIQCEWWWPYEDVVVASQKPLYVKWDGEQRLHCETGPAVEYNDGFALYSWRGISIPGHWITDGPPVTSEIMRLENTEQRRIACEMRGWHNILPDLDAKLIDRDPNPQIGELWEAELPDSGMERFLLVKCGTGRTFVLPVGLDHDTALTANAATYNVPPELLTNLQFRT